ncbi:MAG: hypothetical protein JHC56_10740, partial [Gemmataceae bacterium]|nr:hypothetical protein [Gemmataceae bacterium]
MHTEPSSNDHETQTDSNGDVPLAMPVDNADQLTDGFIPMALPVEVAEEVSAVNISQSELSDSPPSISSEEPVAQNYSKVEARIILCKVCGSQRLQDHNSCQDCGYYFTEQELAGDGLTADDSGAVVGSEIVVAGRYKAAKILREFAGIKIQAGVDITAPGGPVDVLIYSQADVGDQNEVPSAAPPESDESDDFLPSFDDALLSGTSGIEATREMPKLLMWPNLG